MKRLIGSLLFIAVASGCSSDPHKLKITDANKDNFMESLKDTKGLTVEEVGLVASFQMRRAAGKVLGGTESPVVGKTIGEVIAEERKFQNDAKVREEEQKRLAAEAKAKADAQVEELRKALSLTVFEKSFTSSNPSAGSFQDYINIKTTYQNNSGKDIRAFRGRVEFTDLFGAPIYSSGFTISDPVAAGARANWNGQIRYNQFIAEQVRFRNADLKDMKVNWVPASILFADGSSIGDNADAK